MVVLFDKISKSDIITHGTMKEAVLRSSLKIKSFKEKLIGGFMEQNVFFEETLVKDLVKQANEFVYEDPERALSLVDIVETVDPGNGYALDVKARAFIQIAYRNPDKRHLLKEANKIACRNYVYFKKAANKRGMSTSRNTQAKVYRSEGRYKMATLFSGIAERLNPNTETMYSRADNLRKSKKYCAAIKVLDDGNCHHCRASICRAYCYNELEEYELAAECLFKAEESIPGFIQRLSEDPRFKLYCGYIFLFDNLTKEISAKIAEKMLQNGTDQAAKYLKRLSINGLLPMQMKDYHSAMKIIAEYQI